MSRREQSNKPWCVAWRDRVSGGIGWCATWRNMKPSEDAMFDETACGMVVHLRAGEERRQPTCEECRKRVARRRQ